MTTIKQVLLGAAVAGVVAGTGSALGTAIAFAETGPSDNSASASAAGDTESHSSAPAHRTNRGHAATPAPAAATRGAAPTVTDGDVAPPPSNVRAQTTARGQKDSEPPALLESSSPPPAAAPSADSRRQPVETPAPDASPVVASVSSAQAVSTPVSAPVATPAPAAAVAPVSVAPAVVAVEAPRAATTELTPAPAAPEPTPATIPLLPLLPTVPVVPVAPASAASVSVGSGTNSRVRAASAVAQAAVLADPPAHVLLIGVDGTNLDKVLQYTWNNPNSTGFQQLMEAGTTAATSIVGHTTISGPSWSTIMTGVWDTKTGVINNLFNPAPYTKWPTAINMLEAYNPSIATQVVADWKYINDMAGAGGFPADINIYYDPADFQGVFADADQAVTDKTVALINSAQAATPTFLFSYQVQVDEAGHGYGGASPEYKQAVINAGENISEILNAVKASEAAGVEWTVIVTTDHGHQQSKGFGHGFQSPNETSSFIIFDKAGQHEGGLQNQSYSNVDITPTIVNLFGAPLRSDFDGAPLTTKTSGIVDPVDLKTSLNNAVSAYGYPNIGVDIALGTRTVFATVPYLIDGLVTNINNFLQGIVDKNIFLISGLADFTKFIVTFNGDLAVGVTQAIAVGVARLTGSGTIAPTDPPLTKTTQKDQGYQWLPLDSDWLTRLT